MKYFFSTHFILNVEKKTLNGGSFDGGKKNVLMCRVVLVTKDFGAVFSSKAQEENILLQEGGVCSDKGNYSGFCRQYGFLFQS